MLQDYANYAMAAVLIAAMLIEVRTGRIPNWLTLIPFAIFAALLVLTDDRMPLYWQMGIAAAMLVAGLILFAVGGMGAGALNLLGERKHVWREPQRQQLFVTGAGGIAMRFRLVQYGA